MRLFFFLLSLIVSSSAFAQQHPAQEKLSAPVNQSDDRGNKQGMWITLQPARMGEPAYYETGYYSNNRKTGYWTRMNTEGQTEAIEHFSNNVLDGEAKHFSNGRLVCVGQYRGLNPMYKYDTIIVMHPVTQEEKIYILPSEQGTTRHGTWRYYDEATGRLRREEEVVVDEIVFFKDFSIPAADSAYYEMRNKNLPHIKGGRKRPPAGKEFHYR